MGRIRLSRMFMGLADEERTWAGETSRLLWKRGEGLWSLGLGVATAEDSEVRSGIKEQPDSLISAR